MYVVSMNKHQIKKLTYSAICLALCLVLPFLTGQIPQIGAALCPMHLPVLLAGFLCGPWWAAAVGALAPLLRHALFGGMPPLLTAIAMTFELFTYGLLTGLLYRLLPRKMTSVYVSLICAMIGGRIVWGVAQVIILGLTDSVFGWAAFWAGAVANAVPGIIVQLVLIPILVVALQRARILTPDKEN